MGIRRRNLEVYFQNTNPERILDTLINHRAEQNSRIFNPQIHACSALRGIKEESFREWARSVYPGLSTEQLNLRFDTANDVIKRYEKTNKINIGIFALIMQYVIGDDLKIGALTLDDGQPVCKFRYLLNWQSVTNKLGQDLFTAAYLAHRNVFHNENNPSFLYSVILKSDDLRLKNFFKKEFVENHYHLYGSARSFDLNWISLMNNIKDVENYIYSEAGAENTREMDFFLGDNPDSFSNIPEFLAAAKRAALIRAKLFSYLLHGTEIDDFAENISGFLDNEAKIVSDIESCIDDLRVFAHDITYPDTNGISHIILDYAIPDIMIDPSAECYHNRSFFGERYFLYLVFSRILEGTLREELMDLFWYYLVVKSRVRSEFTQSNNRYGFKNFDQYNNRREVFVPENLMAAYKAEMIVQTLIPAEDEQKLSGIEFRLTPGNSPEAYEEKIKTVALAYNHYRRIHSEEIQTPDNENSPEKIPDFASIVIHFIKQTDDPLPSSTQPRDLKCRHYRRREEIWTQAIALRRIMEDSIEIREKIKGIDGASSEVDCRPEVMAPAFRSEAFCFDKHRRSRGFPDRFA